MGDTAGVKRQLHSSVRVALVFVLLYLFLVGVKALESGIKGFGSDFTDGLFESVSNPLAGVFVGILATFLVQSSSVSTSTIVGLVGAGFISYKRSKPIFFGIWWFLICLSPVYNLIPLFNPFADRYLYIPLVGFCVAVAVVLNDVLNSRFYRAGMFARLTPILVIIILGLYSTGTIVRNRDWKDGLTLWSKTVKSSPGSSIAHGSLGHAYQDLGRLEEAVEEYKRAIAINQDDYKAHYNLGTVYDQQGRLDLSLQSYQRSILANPAYANAHFNIGIIYQKLGQLDKAIGHFSKVTELDPADYEARNNLGVAFAIYTECTLLEVYVTSIKSYQRS